MVIAQECWISGIVPEGGLCTLPFLTAEESQNAHRQGGIGQAGEEAHALAL